MGLFDSLIPNITNTTSSGFNEVIGSGVQQLTNFASASPWLKKAEAVGNLDQKGILGLFGSVAPGLGIKEENDQIVLVNPETNKPIASTPIKTTNKVPASAWETAEDRTAEFKVVISQEPVVYGTEPILGFPHGTLTLNVMPTISESRGATYRPFSPLHHPGEILKYENTQARSWNISARLISRNSEEATLNLEYINMIRSWVMPFYGVGTGNSKLKDKLGAPPPILTLKAYGKQMIGPVKCVLETYNWQFPNDCDYLPTKNGIPFPVILQIELTMKESWSPAEYSSFNLDAYRSGDLQLAFGGSTTGAGGLSGANRDNNPDIALAIPDGTGASIRKIDSAMASEGGILAGTGASLKKLDTAMASVASQVNSFASGGRDIMDNVTGVE